MRADLPLCDLAGGVTTKNDSNAPFELAIGFAVASVPFSLNREKRLR